MATKEENPWKKVSSSIVYENKWMKIQEDTVIQPDGASSIYAFMETPRAAGVMAFNDNDELYLVGQYRYPIEQYCWEIIEGGVELEEDPVKAASRELKEEAGLTCSSIELICPPFHISNTRSNEIAYVYEARGLTEGEANPEVTEILEIKTVSFEEALKMVQEGVITDAISVVGILSYATKRL